MRFEIIIALRYVWIARRRAHTAFLSLISTLGLGVGVATLLISLALLSGLQGQIKSRLIASSPHLLIEAAGRNSIPDTEGLSAELRTLGFQKIDPLVNGIAWGSSESGGRGRPLRLRSFQPERPPTVDSSFGKIWKVEPAGRPAILLTREAAAGLGLTMGEDVIVVAPRTKLTPFGPVPVWKRYFISGLLPPSSDEKAPDGFLPFQEASRLFATAGEPTSIESFGSSVERAEEVQKTLLQKYPRLLVKTWKDINRPLFLALRLEKIVMFATISLIIFVASLNLVSSLSMMIVEKRPQVGVLRTLGASDQSIVAIFMISGLVTGIAGTLLGNGIGLGVAWAADRFSLVPLPSHIYYVSHLPFRIDVADVIGVNVVAVVLSLLASWYPAMVASKLDPISAIRDE